jgi:hypothetical protein
MPEWDEPASYQSIAFFQKAINGHSKVSELTETGDQAYEIKRHNLPTVRVWVCDVYEVTSADVAAILAEDPDVDAIVTMSMWNRVTAEAHAAGVEQDVGVFVFKELMGALNYAGSDLVHYAPQEPRRRLG